MNRRQFVGATGGCASYLAAAGPLLSAEAFNRWTSGYQGRVLTQEPFARLEEIGPGLTAVISTPLTGDFTTICNGGIIQGEAGTLVVEAFGTPEGGRWVAERARELTGRWPTHVVVSHYHGDHVAGASGFGPDDGPTSQMHVTQATKDRVLEGDNAETTPWADVVILPGSETVEVDLGGRVVSVVPRAGHTASDVTVQVDGGTGPIWCGDLVWNAMFPNYMDAVPSLLSETVHALKGASTSTYVGGHGPVSDEEALAQYIAMIDSVEEAARSAWEKGMTAESAAAALQVPEDLGEWYVFNPSFYERAMQAWFRELNG